MFGCSGTPDSHRVTIVLDNSIGADYFRLDEVLRGYVQLYDLPYRVDRLTVTLVAVCHMQNLDQKSTMAGQKEVPPRIVSREILRRKVDLLGAPFEGSTRTPFAIILPSESQTPPSLLLPFSLGNIDFTLHCKLYRRRFLAMMKMNDGCTRPINVLPSRLPMTLLTHSTHSEYLRPIGTTNLHMRIRVPPMIIPGRTDQLVYIDYPHERLNIRGVKFSLSQDVQLKVAKPHYRSITMVDLPSHLISSFAQKDYSGQWVIQVAHTSIPSVEGTLEVPDIFLRTHHINMDIEVIDSNGTISHISLQAKVHVMVDELTVRKQPLDEKRKSPSYEVTHSDEPRLLQAPVFHSSYRQSSKIAVPPSSYSCPVLNRRFSSPSLYYSQKYTQGNKNRSSNNCDTPLRSRGVGCIKEAYATPDMISNRSTSSSITPSTLASPLDTPMIGLTSISSKECEKFPGKLVLEKNSLLGCSTNGSPTSTWI